MSILGRFLGNTGGMERRSLTSSAFVPPPAVGVIDDFVGVHRALSHMTVFACVRLLADTIASLPWKVYRRDSKGVPKEVKPQPSLITQPYPGFDLFEWKWMVVASMALRGNSYHLVTSRDRQGYPTAILPLHPDTVFLERQPDLLKWFEPIYRIMGEAVPAQDMIHMRRFTLPGEPWGMSPIRQAAVAIGLGLSAEEYGYRFYKESATPSGTLMTDQDVDDESLKRIQQNWIQSHGGRRLPAVLSSGFKFEPISLRPDECLAKGTLVTMADGTRKVVEDINVGDEVMAWNGSKLVSSWVSRVGSPPIKPMVKITTVRGRELVCTADHPVLGLRKLTYPQQQDPDWILAGDLQPLQYVRVALGHLTQETVPGFNDDIAYFFGAMVGDGNIRKHHPRWMTTDPEVFDRMRTAVESMGGRIVPDGPRNYGIRFGGRGSLISAILNESGLVGCRSHEKFVPELITAGGPAAWKGFISGYLDADGFVTGEKAATPRVTVNCTSQELLSGVQHLMALLGVNASVQFKPSGGGRRLINGAYYDCRDQWTLNVTGSRQVRKLAEQIKLAHPEKNRRLAKHLTDNVTTLRRETTDPYDRIKSVEKLGDGQSIGVTIEDTHTHVTGGLVSHNSQFLETRNFQRSEICIMYGVPPTLIGDTEKATAWGTGIGQITEGAVTYTFRPWTSLIESAVSALLPRGQFVRFDYNALLRGDITGRYGALKTAIDGTFMTPNEARASEEMDPLTNGDELLVPPGFLPISQAGAAAGVGPSVAPGKAPGKPAASPAPAPHLPMPPTGGGENGLRMEEGPANGRGFDLETCSDSDVKPDVFSKYVEEIRVASLDHGKPDAMLNGEEITHD